MEAAALGVASPLGRSKWGSTSDLGRPECARVAVYVDRRIVNQPSPGIVCIQSLEHPLFVEPSAFGSAAARKDHVAVAYLSANFRAWSLTTSIIAFRPGRWSVSFHTHQVSDGSWRPAISTNLALVT